MKGAAAAVHARTCFGNKRSSGPLPSGGGATAAGHLAAVCGKGIATQAWLDRLYGKITAGVLAMLDACDTWRRFGRRRLSCTFVVAATILRRRAFAYVRATRDCWLKDRIGRIDLLTGVDFGSR
jgi:hypothetical protein